MRTITVASAKGGSTKSSTVLTLAARAAQEFGRVAMIDLNADQGTLTEWWKLRGRRINPYLLPEVTSLATDLKVLGDAGTDLCLIDTPPMDMSLIELAVSAADAVVIPLIPSYLDTSAVDCVVEMCRRLGKPFAFLFNAYDERKIFDQVNARAKAALTGRGDILKHHISYSPKHRLAHEDGKAGAEIDKNLAEEIDLVWVDVKNLAQIPSKVVPMKERARGKR
jgi:chromosome partitioning protein